MESSRTLSFDGERARIDGRELSVNRKEMMLQDGEVVFRYQLAGKSYGSVHKKQNTDMIGISLPGKVTDTDGQLCELELDLEPGQSGGYQYPFAPETGNMMYCMPQKETRVNLNLGSGAGADAMVFAECFREELTGLIRLLMMHRRKVTLTGADFSET